MMQAPKKVHTRNDLMERNVENSTIDSHIRRLREKFREVGGDLIETKHGRGFVLFEDQDERENSV